MDKQMLKWSELCPEAITTATGKANSTIIKTLILGILAGAFIAMGGFAAAVASHSISNVSISKFMAGAVFPVGLILVIICGGELFTGNSLMITGILENKITLKAMAKNWIIVYLGNFLGALLIVVLLLLSGSFDINGGKLGGYALKVAYTKSSLTALKALSSGILCNFMVSLAVWGAYAAKDIIGKIFIIWFPIMAFIVGGFEHCVANMYYLFVGLLSKGNIVYIGASGLKPSAIAAINMSNIFHNLFWVTVGNIIGGSVLVGFLYWVVYTQSKSNTYVVSSSSRNLG